MKHYIFCIKDDVITPISLAEENVGEIITALLKQQFFSLFFSLLYSSDD